MMAGMFTSCVDYVQTLSYVDGYFLSNYKVTMSRSSLELMEEEPEEFFGLSQEELEKNVSSYGCGYKANIIDNDLDVGYEFGFAVDGNDESDYDFMPHFNEDTGELYIPFLLGESSKEFESSMGEEDEMSQAVAMAMLNSTKARFIVSKSVISEISGAYFYGEEGDIDLPVYDYGDSYAVEIPLSVLSAGGQNSVDLEYIILYNTSLN